MGDQHIAEYVHGGVDGIEIGGLDDLTLRPCHDQAGLILDHRNLAVLLSAAADTVASSRSSAAMTVGSAAP